MATAACVLALAFQVSPLAQTSPVMMPPGAPGSQTPAPKMAPTGLATNGGSIAHDVYTNSIYGFAFKLPPGWVVLPPRDPVSLKPEPGESDIMSKAQVMRTLLIITENAPLKKSYQRKTIQILATRMLAPPGENTPHDYLTYSQQHAKEKGLPVEYAGDPAEVDIHGRKLWKVVQVDKSQPEAQHVEQYVTTQGTVLLEFYLISPDETGLKDMQPSIQSLQFQASKKPAVKRTPRKRAPATPVKPAAPAG